MAANSFVIDKIHESIEARVHGEWTLFQTVLQFRFVEFV